MKKIILVFCFFSTYAFSQSEVESYLINNIDSIQNAINLDSFGKLDAIQGIRIWSNSQVVELYKKDENIYLGCIINFIAHYNFENEYVDYIHEENKLTSKQTKKLLNQINFEELRYLNASNNIEDNNLKIEGLYNYIIEFGYKNEIKRYSYWLSTNNEYEVHGVLKINNIHNFLIKTISKLKLIEKFNKFRNQLPKGIYVNGKMVFYKTF